MKPIQQHPLSSDDRAVIEESVEAPSETNGWTSHAQKLPLEAMTRQGMMLATCDIPSKLTLCSAGPIPLGRLNGTFARCTSVNLHKNTAGESRNFKLDELGDE